MQVRISDFAADLSEYEILRSLAPHCVRCSAGVAQNDKRRAQSDIL